MNGFCVKAMKNCSDFCFTECVKSFEHAASVLTDANNWKNKNTMHFL